MSDQIVSMACGILFLSDSQYVGSAVDICCKLFANYFLTRIKITTFEHDTTVTISVTTKNITSCIKTSSKSFISFVFN